MKLYKVSPTLLDSFRSVQGKTCWQKEPEELIKQVKGIYEPSAAMIRGGSIHKYLETMDSDLMEEEKIQLKDFAMQFIGASKELRLRVRLNNEIVMSVVIDALLGNIVHEYKTGGRFYGVDTFDNSLQWRMYLLAVDSPKVVYHHFEYTDNRPMRFTYRTFCFYPYQDMKADIERCSYEFIDWCKTNNLEKFITIEDDSIF